MTRWLDALFPNSLKLRLMAAAAIWVLPILALAAILLIWVFRAHLERQLDDQLAAYQRELLAAARIDDGGKLVLDYIPADPRFARAFSGWYWQAAIGDKVEKQSVSAGPTGEGALALLSQSEGIVEVDGPGERELRVFRRDVTLPDAAAPVTVLVAAPCDDLEGDMAQFTRHTVATFSALGLVFLFGVYLQVGFGLRPVARLRGEIADIRTGRRQHLGLAAPDEIAPMVDEVNALIDHNRQLIERARNEAGNLAHALKNPLSVLSAEIAELDPVRRQALDAQVRSISEQVERILQRIRAAGPSAGQASVDLTGLVDDLGFSLRTIYRDRELDLSFDIAPGATFAGDRGDLVEMLGNLCDNACKWARKRVRVVAQCRDKRLSVAIEDDGPGIAPEARAAAMARGQRLDERMPGSGLGLDIVREIVTLYRGKMALGDSAMGGLKVELDLPSA